MQYIITTRFLGYEPYVFETQSLETKQQREIILTEQLNSLETVVLELPMTIRKDTIIYNVDKFTTGEERKLKDVLEKLPGVEVDKDGNIYVNGKKATKFMVENKDFFGGDSKLGVENIPADAIEKVEALDNYNEIAFLKDLDNKDELAINIKLKDGKKNFIFGSVEAGKGNDEYYKASSNLYYYSKKTSSNSIINFNNIREQTFTYRQYYAFQGTLNSVFSDGATIVDNQDDGLQQFVENEDVIDSKRQFGAINIFHEVGSKLNISGYGIFSRSTERSLDQSSNIYNSFTEERTNTTAIDNRLAIGKLKGSYIPNLTDRWDFRTQFKYNDNRLRDVINSNTVGTENTYNESVDNNSNYINQIVEWHKNKSKNHRFSFGATYTYNEGNPRRLIQTTDSILPGLIPVENVENIQLQQLKFSKNHQAKAILKYYWILDRNNHIYTTLGGFFQDDTYRSSDVQIREDGSINDFATAGFGNDLSFRLLDTYFGVHYKRKQGKFTFGQGLFLHNYDWSIQQGTDVKKNKWVLLPKSSIEYEISATNEISFNYQLASNFVNTENYANGFLIETYNTLFRGEANLENELTHSLSLNYNKRAIYRGIGYYLVATYRQKAEGVQRAVNTQQTAQTLSPVFLQQPSHSLRFSGRLYRRISKFKLSLATGYDDQNYDQLLNGSITENQNTRWSYRFNARTVFKNLPTVNIGFSQIFNSYVLGDTTSSFVTTLPSLSADYDFWNGFVASFETSINYYKNKQLNQTNQYSISNAELFYAAQNSPWSFEIKANNIFDVKFKNRNLISAFLISDSQSFVLPRILLFTIGYRL